MFLVYSSLKIDKDLLPSVLYILGEDSELPVTSRYNLPNNTVNEKKFSFININYTRQYYHQHFTHANPNNLRFLGYGIAVFGSLAAFGTFWYSRTQALASVIQAQEAKNQNYHTAREADIVAVETGLISKEMYYSRHPEDMPKK